LVLYDIFGPYATIIGQALSIIAIATLLIQLGRWWIAKRGQRTSEARVYFVLLLVAIISTNMFAMLRSLDEIQESQKIELLNVKLNNATLENQHLIKDVLKQGEKIVNQTKHPLLANGKYVPVG